MGSAKISKNKTRILRYFGDFAKSLWQPLNIDVDMIFRSAIFLLAIVTTTLPPSHINVMKVLIPNLNTGNHSFCQQ